MLQKAGPLELRLRGRPGVNRRIAMAYAFERATKYRKAPVVEE